MQQYIISNILHYSVNVYGIFYYNSSKNRSQQNVALWDPCGEWFCGIK